MAIESVAGAEPTEVTGTATGPQEGIVGVSADAPEGTPFAVIEGREFKTQEELSTWWDAGRPALEGADTGAATGNDSLSGANGNDSISGATDGNDTLTSKEGNDTLTAPARTDDEIKASLKEAGGIYADPKYEPFALEFEKTGALSEASLKAAAEAFGVTPDFVKTFIDGQVAMRENATLKAGQPTPQMIALGQTILQVIPDEAQYKAVLDWGKENLPKDTAQAYDAALDRGDSATAKVLLTSINEAYKASGAGPGPRDVTAEGNGEDTQGVAGYASQGEMEAAMSDPKYATDSAYRAQVARKVAASKY